MANVHIGQTIGGQMQLICHVAIPAGSNSAGVSWQTALVNAKLATATILADGDGTNGTISASEKTSLANGALMERVMVYDLGADWAGLSGANKNARIDAVFTAATAEVQTLLQNRLTYFGFTR